MRLLDILNQRLFQKLGLNLTFEKPVLRFKQFSFQKLQLLRKDKPPIELSGLEIFPKWNFLLKPSGRVRCQKLALEEFVVTEGEGRFILHRQSLEFDVTGLWQQQPVCLQLEAKWFYAGAKNSKVEVRLNLASEQLSPLKRLGAVSQLKLEAPFRLSIQTLFPRNYFQEPDFNALSWKGSLEASALTIDIVRFPEFRMHTEKKEQHPGSLTSESQTAQGLRGKLVLTHHEFYQLSGTVQSSQPVFSRYFKKTHNIEGFGEAVQFDLAVHSVARRLFQLFGTSAFKGTFQVTPQQPLMVEYQDFKGTLVINAARLDMDIPEAPVNHGVLKLNYIHHFGKKYEVHLQLKNVEIAPFSPFYSKNYGIHGRGHGSIVWMSDAAGNIDYTGYNLKILNGELVRSNEWLKKYVTWQELREFRKQFLHIEGFRTLIIKIKRKGADYYLENLQLQGHLQQNLQLTGNIYAGPHLDLLLDATFAQMLSWILTIKGPLRSPKIRPAPARMAGKFVRSSSKAVKGLLDVWRDEESSR